MLENAQAWKNHFSGVFILQTERYCCVWRERLLPTFTDLWKEAEEKRDKYSEKLSASLDPECFDLGDVLEHANDAMMEEYTPWAEVKQGLLNMYPVGLYHLLEQQALIFLQRGLRKAATQSNLCEAKRQRDPSFADLKKALREEHQIDLEAFKCSSKIDELRLVANCVKHGEGKSCRDLRQMQPDWFTPIGPPLRGALVTQPLSGEGIYLKESTLWELTGAAQAFWAELGEAISPGNSVT